MTIKKEKVIELVLSFIEREGRNPVAKDFTLKGMGCGIKPIYRIWGNMEEMFKEIELTPNQISWNTEKVIELIITFIENEGRKPIAKDFTNKGVGCSIHPIYRLWGSMEKMFEEMEIIPNRMNWNKEKVIEQTKLLIKDLKYFPSEKEIDKISKNSVYFPSYPTILKYVGGIEELAKACGRTYLPKNGFSIPIDDEEYGNFASTIEHRIFLQLIKYVEPEDIVRQKKYSELFDYIESQHTADFYIEKYNLIIEATTKGNNIPGYMESQKWKESLSDNIIFVYSIQDVDILMGDKK